MIGIKFDDELVNIDYKLHNQNSCVGLQIFFSKNEDVLRSNVNYWNHSQLDLNNIENDLNSNISYSTPNDEANLFTRYQQFITTYPGTPVYLYFFCPFWLNFTISKKYAVSINAEKKIEGKNLIQKSEILFRELVENISNQDLITNINQKVSSDSKGEYIKQNFTDFDNDTETAIVRLFMSNLFI